ncbi:MAG: hypothetical protein ACI8WT_002793 [Clostridium sp.]|jgi:hypothetical protein
MQEQINKLLTRIDYLEKTGNTQQQYLLLSWAILAVIVGVLAFTMVFLIKSLVNDRVEKELNTIKNNLKNELIIELSENITKSIFTKGESLKNELYSKIKTDLETDLIGYINRTKQIYWASGGNIQVSVSDGHSTFNIYNLAMSTDCDKTIISVEIRSILNGRKINCDYTKVLDAHTITPFISLLDYNKEKDGGLVTWKVIWVNGKL